MIVAIFATVAITAILLAPSMTHERKLGEPTKRRQVPVSTATKQDTVPPTDTRTELQTAFGDIEREIARLQQAGEGGRAEQMSAQLQHFKDRLEGPYTGVGNGTRELHVVGIGEGARSSGEIYSTPTAEVSVTYKDSPVVLVICAGNRVNWTVTTGAGVRIERVILAGYEKQRLAGLPADIPVLTQVYENRDWDHFCGLSKQTTEYALMVRKLELLTGLDITTFQGLFRYEGTPVVVGPENDEWRIQHVLASMRDLHAAATQFERDRRSAAAEKLRFHAVHFARAMPVFHPGSVRFGLFSGTGPIVDSHKPIPVTVGHVAVDPVGPRYYATQRREVCELDIDTGRVKNIEINEELPSLTWIGGLTFDTKRRRLLLATRGKDGFLYSYEPERRQWSVVTGMAKVPLCALAYEPVADVLYGAIAPVGSRAPITTIVTLDMHGQPIDQVTLSRPMPPAMFHHGVQLVAADQHLIMLVPPRPDSGTWIELDGLIYVVNPRTGEVTFSGELPSSADGSKEYRLRAIPAATAIAGEDERAER